MKLALFFEKINLIPCLKELSFKSRQGPIKHSIMAILKAPLGNSHSSGVDQSTQVTSLHGSAIKSIW